MKINSENVKRQRTIALRMKSGKSLVGLLAGLAVSAAMSGCKNPEWGREGYVQTMGVIACPDEQPVDPRAVNEVGEDGVRNIGEAVKP